MSGVNVVALLDPDHLTVDLVPSLFSKLPLERYVYSLNVTLDGGCEPEKTTVAAADATAAPSKFPATPSFQYNLELLLSLTEARI